MGKPAERLNASHVGFLAALLVAACLLARPAAASEADDPSARREATREWYGQDWTPEYRRHVLRVAEEERRQAAKSARLKAGAGAVPTWVSLGPARAQSVQNGVPIPGAQDSGRLSSIVVHPSEPATLYVAASGGGVWKTVDAGRSWRPLTESVGSLAVGALEMDPFDPQTLHLGLGDPYDGFGIGVLKSTDGGGSWSSPTILSASIDGVIRTATFTRQILASPSRPGLVFAATNVGLFRSLDSGASWSPAILPTAPGPRPPEVWSLAWTGGAGFVLSLIREDASGIEVGEVHWSGDDGATWTRASGVSKPVGIVRVSLASAPSNRAIVYALAADGYNANLADIFKSRDGGRSWVPLGADLATLTNPNADASQMRDIFTDQGSYDQLVMVSPVDPDVAYFGGSVLLAKTTNGGLTYSQVSNWRGQYGLPYVHADFQCGAFDAAGNLYVGNDGGIFKSPDAGLTWTSALNVGLVTHLVYSVGSSLANRDAVIGGLQDNGIRARVGNTSTFNQPVGGDGFGVNVNATNAARMLALGVSGMWASFDGGASFLKLPVFRDSGFFFSSLVPWLGDASGNTLYVIPWLSQQAYGTSDYGATWTALGTSGLPASALRGIAAAKSAAGVLAVLTAKDVYLSTSGGASWVPAAPLPGSSGALSSVWFDTGTAQTIYVTSVAPSVGARHLWKTTDFGASWTPLDGGGSGLPNVPFNKVVNDPTRPTTLYLATYLGIYQSGDAGATWTRSARGLPFVEATDIYISPDATLIRASTFGRGFWELASITPPAILVTPPTLPNATLAVDYIQFLAAGGGTSPYTFQVVAGSLPPGLSLETAGRVSGRPSAVGRFCFTIAATDSSTALGGPFAGTVAYCLEVTAPRAAQAISFAPVVGARFVGDPDFAVSASATSGLPVTITSKTLAVCTVAGNLVHLVAAGTCTIEASQPGNESFLPAIAVSQSFAVAPPDVTPPTVLAISRDYPSPTMSNPVTYTVTFSEAVRGVSTASFRVVTTGIVGAAVTAVWGGPTSWSVGVNDGRGTGTLRLDVAVSSGIADLRGNALAGTPVQGDTYQVDKGGTVLGGAGDGSPDPAFGRGGYAPFSAGQSQASPTTAVLADGRILAAGAAVCDAEFYCSPLQVARYLANGMPDTTFGVNGRVTSTTTGIALVSAVIVNGDGTFFVAGTRDNDARTAAIPFVAKFTPSGAPVSTYGNGGVTSLDALPAGSAFSGAALDSAGRMVIAGTAASAPDRGTDIFVARLTPAGAADATFGSGGSVRFGFSTVGNRGDFGSDVAILPDGGILVAGTTRTSATENSYLLLRLQASGALDTTFGTGGVVIQRFASSVASSAGRKMARQADGKTVLVGSAGASASLQCALARVGPDGAPDAGFGTGGSVLLPALQRCLDVVLQDDGKLVLTGFNASANEDVLYATAARVLWDGSLDPTFGSGGLLRITSYDAFTRASITAAGNIVSAVVLEDGADGVQKSYVVELRSHLALPTVTTIGKTEKTVTGEAYAVSVSIQAASAVVEGAVVVEDDLGARCLIAALSSGEGTCTLASLGAGTRTVTARYAGTPSLRPSSATQSHEVKQAKTDTTLESSPNPSNPGEPVSFMARVSAAAPGAGIPRGSVTFSSDNGVLGMAELDATGKAVLLTTALPAGTARVVADYAGDANYEKSKSGKVDQLVGAPPK